RVFSLAGSQSFGWVQVSISALQGMPWHVPDTVQKFYLTGEHMFTYAILYGPATTFSNHPGLLSEAPPYAYLSRADSGSWVSFPACCPPTGAAAGGAGMG